MRCDLSLDSARVPLVEVHFGALLPAAVVVEPDLVQLVEFCLEGRRSVNQCQGDLGPAGDEGENGEGGQLCG